MHISRHKLKNEFMFQMIVDDFYENMDLLFSSAEHNAITLGTNFARISDTIGYCDALKLETSTLKDLLSLASDFGTANFVSSALPNEEFEITYDGNKYLFQRKNFTSYMGGETWINAFCIAYVNGGNRALDLLCKIPESIFLNADIRSDDYDVKITDLLKHIHHNWDKALELIPAVLQSLSSPSNHYETEEYRTKILTPFVETLRSLLAKDDSIDENFTKMLETHRIFWTSKDRTLDVKGWISWHALMIYKLAKNQNVSIGITSDYAPSWAI